MAYETILVENDGPAAVIRFNRPNVRNALSLQLMDELTAALKAAEADAAVRAVIIAGNAELFSAGADLNDALKVASAQAGIDYFGKWHQLCSLLETLPMPVIAAIEGVCMTAGFELALACDLRIAGRSSSFTITSSRIGTVAGAGGTQRLPRLIGRGHALAILFSAEPVMGEDAEKIGLVNRLVDDGAAVSEAKRMASIYAQRAPMSLALAKRAVYRGLDMDLASGLEFETYLVTTIYGTEDKKEGISAFLQRRSPVFKGC
jgi:enoyl-CoA hydratase/carnithine racemase